MSTPTLTRKKTKSLSMLDTSVNKKIQIAELVAEGRRQKAPREERRLPGKREL